MFPTFTIGHFSRWWEEEGFGGCFSANTRKKQTTKGDGRNGTSVRGEKQRGRKQTKRRGKPTERDPAQDGQSFSSFASQAASGDRPADAEATKSTSRRVHLHNSESASRSELPPSTSSVLHPRSLSPLAPPPASLHLFYTFSASKFPRSFPSLAASLSLFLSGSVFLRFPTPPVIQGRR